MADIIGFGDLRDVISGNKNTAFMKKGLATKNRFSVNIFPTGDLVSGLLNANNRAWSLQADSASIPGKSFNTTERKTHGPVLKLPYDASYNEFTCTFKTRPYLSEKQAFHDWMDIIEDPLTKNIQYFDRYSSRIVFAHYTRFDHENPAFECTMIDAYPINIADMDFNMGDNDQYATFTVTFAYKYYKTESKGSD